MHLASFWLLPKSFMLLFFVLLWNADTSASNVWYTCFLERVIQLGKFQNFIPIYIYKIHAFWKVNVWFWTTLEVIIKIYLILLLNKSCETFVKPNSYLGERTTGIYLFKVKYGNTRAIFENSLKFTIKAPKRYHGHCSYVSIANLHSARKNRRCRVFCCKVKFYSFIN